MAAAKLTLPVIEKGATYRNTLYWKDSLNVAINLTGCTAKLQVRDTIDTVIPSLELSTLNGGIIITPLTGKIDLYIASNITTLLVGTGGVYDLEIYLANGDITRLIEGKVVYKAEVTR
jgi:hypothetical protein